MSCAQLSCEYHSENRVVTSNSRQIRITFAFARMNEWGISRFRKVVQTRILHLKYSFWPRKPTKKDDTRTSHKPVELLQFSSPSRAGLTDLDPACLHVPPSSSSSARDTRSRGDLQLSLALPRSMCLRGESGPPGASSKLRVSRRLSKRCS